MGLGIHIYNTDALAGPSQTGSQVDRGRRLADTPLLVHDRDSPHALVPPAPQLLLHDDKLSGDRPIRPAAVSRKTNAKLRSARRASPEPFVSPADGFRLACASARRTWLDTFAGSERRQMR